MTARRSALVAVLVALVLLWALSDSEQPTTSPLSRSSAPDPDREPPGYSAPVPGEAGEGAKNGEAPEKPPPKIDLSVRVTRPGGEPVSGATVTVLEQFVYRELPWDPLESAPNERARTLTGEDGTALLTFPGKSLHGVQVVVWTADHAARSKTLFIFHPGEVEVSLELGPSPPIRVEVVDQKGLRIRDAHVRVIAPDTPSTMLSSTGAYGFEMSPVTRGDGVFEFTPVAMEKDPLLDEGEFLVTARASGFQPLDRWIAASKVGSGEIELRMVRRVTVRGRCVDEAGRPVVGVPVGSEWTGENGTFELPDRPETGGRLLVSPPSHVPFVVRIPAADGPVVDLGDLVLREGDTMGGEVVDDDGRPVANARVSAWHRDLGPNAARRTWTGRGGDFTVRHLGEGPHVVQVMDTGGPPPGPGPGGGGWADRKVKVKGVPAGTRDMRIRLSGGMLLRIDFVLEDGSPAKIIYVHVVARHLEVEDHELGWWPSYEPLVRFRMKRPGKHRITVACSGYETTTQTVEVMADREARIKVVMKKVP